MDLRTKIAARITHQLVTLRGTGKSLTVDLGDVFYQAASYKGDKVLIEVSAEQFIPDDRQLEDGRHEELLRLGFNRPTPSMPNWWIGIEDGKDRALFTAAQSTTSALLDLYLVGIDALADELRIGRSRRRSAASPEPSIDRADVVTETTAGVVVETDQGTVLLFPDGRATREGEAWSDQPLSQWAFGPENRLEIVFNEVDVAGHQSWSHGSVENTRQNIALLRQFTPEREEWRPLTHRLAVAEQYTLTCITFGSIYATAVAHVVSDLEREYHDRPPAGIHGWTERPRLIAATEAVSALWFAHSADSMSELRQDEHYAWLAIQKWVRLSPWRDDFDFEIVPDPDPSYVVAGHEVQIQRVY